MDINKNKIQKLAEIARMYYEKDMTQNHIAKQLNVSRPLISRMLKEAKALGIVNIQITVPLDENDIIFNQLRSLFNVKGGLIVPDAKAENLTDSATALSAVDYVKDLGAGAENIGIGWGSIIGNYIGELAKKQPVTHFKAKVCPLIGNSSVSNRNYHSNEIVRIFAETMGAAPVYMYAPAFVETEQEMLLYKKSANFEDVESIWNKLDLALVNIGNYPSVPDFAVAARYGDELISKKPSGRLISYLFTQKGEIIKSPTDYAIQIPIDTLAACKCVVGICSASTKPKAILGALRTGLISHIIAPENTIHQVIEMK